MINTKDLATVVAATLREQDIVILKGEKHRTTVSYPIVILPAATIVATRF